MRDLTCIEAVRRCVGALRAAHGTVGFVPTMGNLHAGHLELVRHAARHNGAVVVSIYVNPLQFEPGEDLATYPRTLEADRAALEDLGVAGLFLPDEATMYPRGMAQQTRVVVPGLGGILCGVSRPHHFEGVTTVVARLLNIVGPDMAVFGRKDYQQLAIIRRMAADLAMPVAIEGVATARAEDGLALSSRNQYLDERERRIAPGLYRTLNDRAQGIQSGQPIEQTVSQGIEALARLGFQPDYLEVRRQADLAAPESEDRELVILAAAYLGKARLIDNLEFSR